MKNATGIATSLKVAAPKGYILTEQNPADRRIYWCDVTDTISVTSCIFQSLTNPCKRLEQLIIRYKSRKTLSGRVFKAIGVQDLFLAQHDDGGRSLRHAFYCNGKSFKNEASFIARRKFLALPRVS